MRYLLLLLLLTGCASQVIKEPVEVKVPVPVPCEIKAPSKPIIVTQSLGKDASRFTWLKERLKDAEKLEIYTIQLEVALGACNGSNDYR